MLIVRSNRLIMLAIVVSIFAILLVNNPAQCLKIRDDDDVEAPSQETYEAAIAQNKKFRVIYKILKAYLNDQIEQLDRLSGQDEEDSKFLNSLVDRRQLKSQGIMERLKNKMDHDVNKYGWD